MLLINKSSQVITITPISPIVVKCVGPPNLKTHGLKMVQFAKPPRYCPFPDHAAGTSGEPGTAHMSPSQGSGPILLKSHVSLEWLWFIEAAWQAI